METLTKKSKLTKEQIALCFGERTGYDVEPKDIRIRGNWLFHRTRMGLFDRYNKEVYCYWAENARYNSGVLCMEPWDAVEYENSPFIPKNDKKVSIELKRLDKDYQQHLYEQTEEGQLEKRQEKAVSEYLNNIIKNKKYGKLLEIESFREQAPIRNDSDVVWDLGVHDISILRFLLNSNPIKIHSLKYNTVKTKQKDTAYINLEYKNDLKVFIKNSWISPLKIRIMKFKFEKAIIICDENEPIYKIRVFTRKNNKTPNYKLELPEIDLSEPLFNLIQYVAKSIKTNSNSIFKNNFNLDITKVLEKI